MDLNGPLNDDNLTFEWFTAGGTPIGTNSATFNATDYIESIASEVTFPMEFMLTVSNDGCEMSKNVVVEDIYCSIQKGISPNNDGKNDYFDLVSMNVDKLSIFNRYGQEVYTKNQYKNEWHGQSNKGDELPSGTYYYVIERSNGEASTGWIYINRQE